MDNVSLKFSDEALTAIAKLAMERQTGARGLRSILVRILFVPFEFHNLTFFHIDLNFEILFFVFRKNCYWTQCLRFLALMWKQCSSLRNAWKDRHHPNIFVAHRLQRAPTNHQRRQLQLRKKRVHKFVWSNNHKRAELHQLDIIWMIWNVFKTNESNKNYKYICLSLGLLNWRNKRKKNSQKKWYI